MKKITLLAAIICSITFASAKVYLVELGTAGSTTWRTAGVGEENIYLSDLAKPLNSWNNGKGLAAGDQVWIAAGTYVMAGPMFVNADVSIYGGFKGTETAISQRSKVSGGNAWDFTNPTIIDGGGGNFYGIVTPLLGSVNPAYIDGFSITNYAIIAVGLGTNGSAAQLFVNQIMQNCIIYNNSAKVTAAGIVNGGAIDIEGGQLLNSYLHHNYALRDAGATSNSEGGAVIYYGNTTAAIKGCLFENNSSVTAGGAVYMGDNKAPNYGGGTIENCIFRNNTSLTGFGGAIGTYLADITTVRPVVPMNIKSCQFIGNTSGAHGGAMNWYSKLNPLNMDGCVFVGNTANNPTVNGGGALFISSSSVPLASPIQNCIFRDNKTIGNVAQEGSAIVFANVGLIQNCVIANNSALADRSAVYFAVGGNKMYNCTVVNNFTSGAGSAVKCNAGTTDLINNIFVGNSVAGVGGAGTMNTTYNGTDGQVLTGVGNIATLTIANTFIAATDFVGVPTTDAQKAEYTAATWQLKKTSPAVGAGTDLIDFGVEKDLLGVERPVPYDLGAYQNMPNTGISELKITFGCYSANQHIELREIPVGQTITIYGLAGNVITSFKAKDSSVSIPSSKGIYLVRVANSVNKVIVR